MFKIIHQSVEIMSNRFRDEMRRINYVTPTSYLELLNSYKKVYKERKYSRVSYTEWPVTSKPLIQAEYLMSPIPAKTTVIRRQLIVMI